MARELGASALYRQAYLRDVVLSGEGPVDRVGDSLCNPPCCRKRRPRQNTNKSRFVSVFRQDLADQRLVDLVGRLGKNESEPGECAIRAASAERPVCTSPANQTVMNEISEVRLDDAGRFTLDHSCPSRYGSGDSGIGLRPVHVIRQRRRWKQVERATRLNGTFCRCLEYGA